MSPPSRLHLAHRTEVVTASALRATARLPAPVVALTADSVSDGWIALDANDILHRIDRDGRVTHGGERLPPSTATYASSPGLLASGRWLYAWRGSRVTVLDCARLATVATLVEPLGDVSDAAPLAEGEIAWVVSGCRAVRVWNLHARECVASYGSTDGGATGIATHPGAGRIALADTDGGLTLFDHAARRPVGRIAKVGGQPRALAWIDAETLAWIGYDELVLIGFEGTSPAIRTREAVSAREVTRTDDAVFIVGSKGVSVRPREGSPRAWRFAGGEAARVSTARQSPLAVAAADAGGAVNIHVDAGQDEGDAPPPLARIFHSESARCVLAWGPEVIARWRPGEDAVTRREIAPSIGAELSADGRWLVVLREAPHTASVIDAATLTERVLPASGRRAALSPTGRHAALTAWGAPVLIELETATPIAFSSPLSAGEAAFSEDGREVYVFDATGALARCALDGTVLARVDFACRWGYANDLTASDGGVRGVWPAPDDALVVHVGTPIVDAGTYDNWDGTLRGTTHALLLLDATTLATRRRIRALASAPATLALSRRRDAYALIDGKGVAWVEGLREGADRVALSDGAPVSRLTVDPREEWFAFATPEGAALARASDGEGFAWRSDVPVRDVAVDAQGGLYALDALGSLSYLTRDEGGAR